jgi:hypothetical protein
MTGRFLASGQVRADRDLIDTVSGLLSILGL